MTVKNTTNWNSIIVTIGVVAIGTLGTQALPNKERKLSIRNPNSI